MRLRPPVGLLPVRSPIFLLGRLFRKNTSSSALSLNLLEFISEQSAYTDSLPSVLSSPHSVVTRLGDFLDFLGRSTASSIATFLTSRTDASREGWGRLPGTTQPDHLRYVVSSGVSFAHKQSRKASSLSSCFSFPTYLRDFCVMVSTKNTSVGVNIQAQWCIHDHPLYLETRNFFLCKNLNISLSFKHKPGRLNALSDILSCKHQFLLSDCTFHQEVTS
ncbi:hypothetical protein DPMN_015368 [Dreissena polymorpha]|uniref:Uncharacterized protein n=1 Tax=Dreissena polymorpha TaxID=45954 RepID=A0A9D4N916_DREPO|nr:hypothetical protein DPMN_015368 [Dreissena polymorpha]